MIDATTIEAENGFAEQYLLLRKKEGRICTDEMLLKLPYTSPSPSLQAEWQVRSRSAAKLFHYLQSKNRKLRILEAGCGNGWLAHYLSAIKGSEVVGIECNPYELEQAKRVFKKRNLSFINGAYPDALVNEQFDMIIFAASIQYYYSLDHVITSSMMLLHPGGELHFIDSHFYIDEELLPAQQRSRDYFRALGLPGMTAYYHHHRLIELMAAGAIRMKETNLFGRLFHKHPFHWYYITKH